MFTNENKLRENGNYLALRLPVAMRMAECAIRFLVGAVLAGAEMFGGFAMCGVAMTAASGAGVEGFAALLGAGFGYLAFRGLVDGLRYVAAAVLVFALAFALADGELCRRTWFMPLSAAVINGLVGFIYLSESGWPTAQVIFFFSEVILTGALVYFYRVAFSVWEDPREAGGLTVRQTVGCLVLGCTILMTLAQIQVLEELSLGRIFAALLVMLAGWKGGVGVGSAVGVMAGLAMDLSAGAPPYYTTTYAFAGLMTGVFWKQGKLFTAMAYVVANAAAVLWTWEAGPRISLLYEVFIASVVFLILPERLLRRLSDLIRQDQVEDSARRARAYAVRRLEQTAEAFRTLAAGLRSCFAPQRTNLADAGKIFTRAADRVCLKCALRDLCWHRDYHSTRAACNDVLPTLLDKGRGTVDDYPPHFSGRCVKMGEFVSAVNEELALYLARRQYQAKVRESRGAVCEQYGQLAAVLQRISEELAEELAVDVARQRRLRQRLTALGLEGETAVYCDENGHLRVEVSGGKLAALNTPEELKNLSHIMGVPLRAEEDSGDSHIKLAESEPLMAVAGIAARRKEGESVSGDAGAWFKDEAGRLHIFLCDGMGSGAEAHADSSAAIDLLEKFLRAGVEPAQALATLNGALALKGEETGGFTTVDLLRVDLFTGKGALFKFGAAPTYLLREGKVRRYSGQSLPAGLTGNGARPDVLPLELKAGDWLVMASDGVAGGEEDWLAKFLVQWEGDSPRLLAQQLIEGCAHRQEGQDDKTVVALKLTWRRDEG